MSEEYKQQVYKKWLDNGQPGYHIDKSKEPTAEERKIILEMQQGKSTRKDYTVKEFARLLDLY